MPLYNPQKPDRVLACELNFRPGEEIVDSELVQIHTDLYNEAVEVQAEYNRQGGQNPLTLRGRFWRILRGICRSSLARRIPRQWWPISVTSVTKSLITEIAESSLVSVWKALGHREHREKRRAPGVHLETRGPYNLPGCRAVCVLGIWEPTESARGMQHLSGPPRRPLTRVQIFPCRQRPTRGGHRSACGHA
jgi:hypothetical protein